ncbi:hypothetical protein BDN72DRAFT_850467 [Pluteus cervinus]|uniref:Uncharacterized protein n=1 Tax=Pluteus cervinus TaxID=181527 RepID=A0ACD3A4E8_9AGAR|nr:hypothetical protein BDN72DRAFT_850467 [Pluteus cervinus]
MAQIPNHNIHKSSEVSTKLVEASALGDHVNALRSQNKLSIVELEAKANALINELARDQKDVYEVDGSSLRLHGVLKAMLDNANIFDGEDSLKYAAEAICDCSRTEGGVDHTLQELRDLARTWLSHFLYPFKSSHSHVTQKNKSPAEVTTPTLDKTRSILGGDLIPIDRPKSQTQLILERDGHQCSVSGKMADTHPLIIKETPGIRASELHCAHVLRCAVAVIGNRDTEEFHTSSSECFDILKNYCGLSEDRLKDLNAFIDHPINSFMLRETLYTTFDKFRWTLIPTEGDNRYKLKNLDPIRSELEDLLGGRTVEDVVVEFKDHRRESAQLRGEKTLPPAIPLPDPLFFKIHAAVGGILKMSGAGKFFDELLAKYDHDKDPMGAPSFDDVVRSLGATEFGEEFRKSPHIRSFL